MAVFFSDITVPRPEYLGAGEWKLTGLKGITVIFGKNGAGKSILLKNIFGEDPENRFLISPERSGEFQWNAQFLQEESTAQGRGSTRMTNAPVQYRERIMSRTGVYLTNYALAKNEDKKILNPEEFQNLLKILLPDFTITLIPSPPYLKMIRLNNEEVSNKDHLSSGEIGLLFLALDIISTAALWEMEEKNNNLLLIDEPDTHLHPDLQRQFAEFLIRIIDRFNIQILVASHSTSLLASISHYGQTMSSLIYLDNKGEEQPTKSFSSQLNKMSTILGGHALMGPLFSLPILLVEGSDDFVVWNQVSRSPNGVKLSIIDCGGDSNIPKYKKELETIFNSLIGVPANTLGFTLKDGDNKNQPPIDTNSHIQNLRLSCLELENMYLTDGVLKEMGYETWVKAAEKIVNEAEQYGAKANFLKQAQSWDRKKTDIKTVISETSQILDSRRVPWQVRLGKTIGKEKPTGQLADFLGETVISKLWGG